jgi:hypothetical protein
MHYFDNDSNKDLHPYKLKIERMVYKFFEQFYLKAKVFKFSCACTSHSLCLLAFLGQFHFRIHALMSQ